MTDITENEIIEILKEYNECTPSKFDYMEVPYEDIAKAIMDKIKEEEKPKYKIERISDIEQIKQNIRDICKED